ncbi:Chromosome transmission fidelity protein 18 [Sporothrix stenoceras]|uniref:Chromosome transmission fidelity protein 18 n=1 Tax=Sporothrix stenoceras TaxID=5173 RepID=A0ABR3YN79_9PEZI
MDTDVVSQRVAAPLPSVETVQTVPATAAPQPVKRTLGGFVDSDDEDEDDDIPSATAPITTLTQTTSTQPAATEANTNSTAPSTQPQPTTHSTEPLSTQPTTNISQNDDTNMHDAQVPSQFELDDLMAQSAPPNEEPESQEPGEHEENEEDRYDLLFSAAPAADPIPKVTPTTTSTVFVQTCSGRSIPVRQRSTPRAPVPYEAMVAQRSKTKEGRAQRNYYGIAIHELVDGARKEMATQKEAEKKKATEAEAQPVPEVIPEVVETKPVKGKGPGRRPKKTMLWTEKYRARSFMDLVGDDLTNRLVLRWLKRWDPLVFPGAKKRVPLVKAPNSDNNNEETEKPHRKILILTGPPGLGKTTLAHVCARQAGYEVLEINASDDRSRDVVNGRIRTSLGTESVKAVEQTTIGASSAGDTKKGKVARPVCVIVDEVDGVVGGTGSGGEGGFVKALIDLVLLDQKNSGGGAAAQASSAATSRRRKRGDDFRQMRPLVLICNDIYHPALRPLRLSGLAEIVHVGKPTVETVVTRLKSIFEKEGIPCEKEAARKLCEAAWGMATGSEAARRGTESTAEGDLRGVMVVGEWVARRLRATASKETLASASPHLTRSWVDKHILPDLASGGGGGGIGARGLGRGGVREIVTRIFQEGAGFPKTAASTAASSSTSTASASGTSATTSYRHEQPKEQMSFAEAQQRYSMGRLREMIETSGDVDRIMTDIFGEYPHREFNDDSYLSKPDAAYEWMHFHDACARRVFGSQEWELAPYTSQPVLACHQLFATSKKHVPEDTKGGGDENRPVIPFTGPRADFLAREAEKHSRAALQTIQAQLPPSLLRAFRNAEDLASDFLPYVLRLVSPDVKPVLVNVVAAPTNNGKSSGPTAVASVRREGEKILVRRAAEVLAELGIKLQRGILEDPSNPPASVGSRPQWVYRMEPDLDMLASFETASGLVMASNAAPTRYAVRQVLDQELRKTLAARDNAARQARFQAGTALGVPLGSVDDDKENQGKKGSLKRKSAAAELEEAAVKRDFFGRIIAEVTTTTTNALQEVDGNAREGRSLAKNNASTDDEDRTQRVWVTFHEGLNNAVRKPISVDEFLRGL